MGGGLGGRSVRCPGRGHLDPDDRRLVDGDGIDHDHNHVVGRHGERLVRVEQLFVLDVVAELGQFHGPEHEPVVMSVSVAPIEEVVKRFECFGGACAVVVAGGGPAGSPSAAADKAMRRMLEWHRQFSRFEPASELSVLNRDPRETVPVSALMARFVEAAVHIAAMTGGLVDPTLVTEVEQAGYADNLDPHATGAAVVSRPLGDGRPASPHPAARWREITVDRRRSTVTRLPGTRLDSGGIAKGMFGDVLAWLLARHASFAVEAAGDLRFGGAGNIVRRVQVTHPFDVDAIVHTFKLEHGAAATSGTTRRSWIDADGRAAHHLLDPASGRPAFTGIVQATALAPSGLEAEALAKAALLSGPERAHSWLPHGGVVVYEDGNYDVLAPRLGEGLR